MIVGILKNASLVQEMGALLLHTKVLLKNEYPRETFLRNPASRGTLGPPSKNSISRPLCGVHCERKPHSGQDTQVWGKGA